MRCTTCTCLIVIAELVGCVQIPRMSAPASASAAVDGLDVEADELASRLGVPEDVSSLSSVPRQPQTLG